MRIGIIGLGVVGGAVASGLKALGHDIKAHDIRFDTTANILVDTEISFVCVPTPSSEFGKCDTNIVENVIN